MKGYKVPQHMIEGRKNWIAQYQKDDKYAWGMSAVIEDIESLPLEELDDNWHTVTPTEDGWYLCAYDTDIYLANYWCGCGWLKQYRAEGIDCRQGLVAWQKIEPYRGE